MKKRLTRGRAIVLFCHECNGYDSHRSRGTGSVSYLEAGYEVSKCPDTECPLWAFRMGHEIEETSPKRTERTPLGAEISA